jgi:hypothetical protein
MQTRNVFCKLLSIQTLLTVVLLSSCSDEPSALNSVGTQFLQTQVVVKTDTLSAVNSSTFKHYVPMNGGINLVGKTEGYAAYTLLQFYPGYFPQRDTVLITSARLILRGVTWFGDSAATLGFDAFEINQAWSEFSFRWDSLTTGFYNSGPNSSRGTYTGNVEADTQLISVDLDTSMVRRWFQSTTYTENYGLILIPSQNTNVVRGFQSFASSLDSLYPQIIIATQNVAGTTRDTATYIYGQDTFLGNIDNLDVNPELTYLQSGVIYGGSLTLDVSSIPKGAIISQAQLTLTLDRQASRINKFVAENSIVAYAKINESDSTAEPVASQGTGAPITSNLFIFDLRHQVQGWVGNQSSNYGLLLRSLSDVEYNSFNLFAFFNQRATDPGKRPQLLVKYTVQTQ